MPLSECLAANGPEKNVETSARSQSYRHSSILQELRTARKNLNASCCSCDQALRVSGFPSAWEAPAKGPGGLRAAFPGVRSSPHVSF